MDHDDEETLRRHLEDQLDALVPVVRDFMDVVDRAPDVGGTLGVDGEAEFHRLRIDLRRMLGELEP